MKQPLLKLSVALAPRGKVCEDDVREPGLVVYTDNKRTIEPNMTIGVQPDDSLAEYIAKIQRTGIRKSVKKGSESCHRQDMVVDLEDCVWIMSSFSHLNSMLTDAAERAVLVHQEIKMTTPPCKPLSKN